MAKRVKKNYYCNVVSEDVEIALKVERTISLNSKKRLYVQCDQDDCQYVDINELPCPLNLSIFEEEIKERAEKARESGLN